MKHWLQIYFYPISHLFENNKDFIIAFNCLQKFLSKRRMLMYRNHVSFISSKFLTNCCLTTVEKILIFLLPLFTYFLFFSSSCYHHRLLSINSCYSNMLENLHDFDLRYKTPLFSILFIFL